MLLPPGNEIALFLFDLALCVYLAHEVTALVCNGQETLNERLSILLLLFLSIVVGTALVLGSCGQLNPIGFLLAHLVALAALLKAAPYCRNHGAPKPARERRDIELSGVNSLAKYWILLFPILLITTFLAGSLYLNLITAPLNFDSHSYRLSRIAVWLQQGNLDPFPTNDPRHEFMAWNADLVMLWLLSFFGGGWPFTKLTQWLGGLLMLASAFGLARLCGLSLTGCWIALVVVLAMPNVGLQFLTTQTDLFTTGCLTAGVLFFIRFLRRPVIAYALAFGMGLGLAMGSKATVFYLGPGLLLASIFWMYVSRSQWRLWIAGAALPTALICFLGLPKYVFNIVQFENPFASPAFISAVHDNEGVSRGQKTAFNLSAYAWQTLGSQTNPYFPSQPLDELSDRVGLWMPKFFRAASNAFDYSEAKEIFRRARLNEDMATFGLIAPLLFFFGLGFLLAGAIRRRSRAPLIALSLGTASLVSLFLFAAFQNWTLHKFRYFVLAAPYMAIVSAYPVTLLKMFWQRAILIVFTFATLLSLHSVVFKSRSTGMATLRGIDRHGVWQSLNAYRSTLDLLREAGEPTKISLALPMDSLLGGFMRNQPNDSVELVALSDLERYSSAERFMDATDSDLLITTPRHAFAEPSDHLIRYQPSHLSRGKSIVAYARSEKVRDLLGVIKNRVGFLPDGWCSPEAEFELSDWFHGEATLVLHNTTPIERNAVVRSAIVRRQISLRPMEAVALKIGVLPQDRLTVVIEPPYVAADFNAGSVDRRHLGLRLYLLDELATFVGPLLKTGSRNFSILNLLAGELVERPEHPQYKDLCQAIFSMDHPEIRRVFHDDVRFVNFAEDLWSIGGRDAFALLRNSSSEHWSWSMNVICNASDLQRPITVSLVDDGSETALVFEPFGSHATDYQLVPIAPGEFRIVRLRSDRAWSPGGADQRLLGVRVTLSREEDSM